MVRLSGAPAALAPLIAAVVPGPLPPREAVLRRVLAADGKLLDRALAIRFVAPRSYTGEEVVEVHLHGNPVVLQACVAAFVAAGARPAEPGEFTRRAVAHGRLDLVEAEAVDAVVQAATVQAVRAAQRHLGGELSARLTAWRDALLRLAVVLEALVDFPEDVQDPSLEGQLAGLGALASSMHELAATFEAGRRAAHGARVVLAGPVNAGKSTLFNALLGQERAIVSEHAGTTRDVVSEAVDWGGVAVRLEDTAGQRPTSDPVEAQGVARSQRALLGADLVLHVRDARDLAAPGSAEASAYTESGASASSSVEPGAAEALAEAEAAPPDSLTVATHCDLAPCPVGWLPIALDRGVPALRDAIVERLRATEPLDLIVHTQRQKNALVAAGDATREAAAHGAAEPVLCAVSVRSAGQALDELLGGWTSEAVLDALFSRFCIGK